MPTHYDVVAEPEGRWWVVTVPALDIVGQARHLSEIDDVATDIICLWLGCSASEITTSVTLKVPDTTPTQRAFNKATKAEEESERLA